jgi:hypothetical protein
MNQTIKFIAEFELGIDASREVTEDFFRNLIAETLQNNFSYALLSKEKVALFSIKEELFLPIKIRAGDTGDKYEILQKEIFSAAQRGFCLAIILEYKPTELLVLEQNGYVKCSIFTDVSKSIIKNWTDNLTRNISSADGGESVLVFGHDFDPVFLFGIERG